MSIAGHFERSSSREAVDRQRLSHLQRRIRVARGEVPGDLLLSGGNVVDVFTQQVQPGNVVIADGWIAGVGPYDWEAHEHVPLAGQYVLPGLIDAHMHLESTLLLPAELARLVVPQGTATMVADPHEVANVLGTRGVEMLLTASESLPLDILFMVPSCVPAVCWEDAGAVVDAAAVRRLLSHPRILGLAEMMDVAGVLEARQDVLEKILAAQACAANVDGHAPGLAGRDLVAYTAAGIRSDHESTTVEEALAKASLGMMVQVREGSCARNLDALLPLLVEDKLGDWCLATDDIQPDDLAGLGHINHLLRRVVAAGVPAARAVRHATLTAARHYGLADRGAVAPGFRADLLAVPDLVEFRPQLVIHHQTVVAREGTYLADWPPPSIAAENSVHMGPISEDDFRLSLRSDSCPVIGVLADQIVTRCEQRQVRHPGGCWSYDPEQDLVLVACVERHRATGRVGLGLASGFGLRRRAALGASVAHDSHNLIIAGTDPRDLLACARALAHIGGGLVVVAEGQVRAQLPLPLAGLISMSSADVVCHQLQKIRQAARNLGCRLPNPLGTLSFLALPVIPELRITDRGLFDVREQRFVRL